ncbi:MAG: thiolase family protein, partial [Thermoleophilia bacterium]|nr:thiolase family protein [Thermoleophilia bacterium]
MTEALIAGAGETQYVRRPDGAATLEVLARAARAALDDAGFEPRQVDGLAVSSFTLQPDHAVDLAFRLGLRLRWLMDDASGGASALNMLQHARRAVESGDADVTLLVAGDVLQRGAFGRLADTFNSAARDHLAPLPHGGPNALFALLTRRHMRVHGLARETYGKVVIAQREWAAHNPGAVYRTPLTMDDYLGAPLVADPLGRYDCVPIVSGADAVLVASSEHLRREPAVAIGALAGVVNADGQDGDGLRTGLAELAPRLWEEAGVGPEDVDVVSVYDDYPVMVLVQLADL